MMWAYYLIVFFVLAILFASFYFMLKKHMD